MDGITEKRIVMVNVPPVDNRQLMGKRLLAVITLKLFAKSAEMLLVTIAAELIEKLKTCCINLNLNLGDSHD